LGFETRGSLRHLHNQLTESLGTNNKKLADLPSSPPPCESHRLLRRQTRMEAARDASHGANERRASRRHVEQSVRRSGLTGDEADHDADRDDAQDQDEKYRPDEPLGGVSIGFAERSQKRPAGRVGVVPAFVRARSLRRDRARGRTRHGACHVSIRFAARLSGSVSSTVVERHGGSALLQKVGEQHAIVHERLAELLGVHGAVVHGTGQLVSGSIVLNDVGMLDG